MTFSKETKHPHWMCVSMLPSLGLLDGIWQSCTMLFLCRTVIILISITYFCLTRVDKVKIIRRRVCGEVDNQWRLGAWMDTSCNSGISTLETYYSNFIARQLYAQKCLKDKKSQCWPPGYRMSGGMWLTLVVILVIKHCSTTPPPVSLNLLCF